MKRVKIYPANYPHTPTRLLECESVQFEGSWCVLMNGRDISSVDYERFDIAAFSSATISAIEMGPDVD